jgi:hypothetical protein
MAKPPSPAPLPSETAGQQPRGSSSIPHDPTPDDLGHESMESNIKQNTTDQGQRKDRGD